MNTINTVLERQLLVICQNGDQVLDAIFMICALNCLPMGKTTSQK